jgi:hypothetical protein
MMMKAKKDYTKPTMKVVMLRHAGMLMTSDPSGVSAQRSSYTHGRTDGGSGTDEEVWQ